MRNDILINWMKTRALIYFAMIFPALFIWLRLDVSPDPNKKLLYGLCKLLQISIPLIYWKLNRIEFRLPLNVNWRVFIIGLASGLLIASPIYLSYFFIFRHSPWLMQTSIFVSARVKSLGLTSRNYFFIYAGILSLIHSGFEEYYWRSFIFSACRRFYSLRLAMLLSAAAFTLHHIILLDQYVGHSRLLLTGACSIVFLGGIVWSVVYDETKSILASWVSHILADVAVMAILFDLSKL